MYRPGMQRHDGGDTADGGGCAHRMPQQRLGGADGNILGPVSKKTFNGPGFHDISKRRGGGMRIDMVNRIGSHTCVLDSASHCRYLALHVWHYDMRGVTCLSIA